MKLHFHNSGGGVHNNEVFLLLICFIICQKSSKSSKNCSLLLQICLIFLISFPVLSKVIIDLGHVYGPNRKNIHPWVGGWLGGHHLHNHTTSWLHLASWNLPDYQLCWESKMEPKCGNNHETSSQTTTFVALFSKSCFISETFCSLS